MTLTYSWVFGETTTPTGTRLTIENLEGHNRIRLALGERAPYAGVLLSDAANAALLAGINAERARATLEIDQLKKLLDLTRSSIEAQCAIKLAAAQKETKIERESCNRRQTLLEGAVATMQSSCDRKWYESPYFTMGLSSLVCAGAAIGGAYAAGSR